MRLSEHQIGVYAEKIAQRLFKAPDGRQGTKLLLTDGSGEDQGPIEDHIFNDMNWDEVIEKIKEGLHQEI